MKQSVLWALSLVLLQQLKRKISSTISSKKSVENLIEKCWENNFKSLAQEEIFSYRLLSDVDSDALSQFHHRNWNSEETARNLSTSHLTFKKLQTLKETFLAIFFRFVNVFDAIFSNTEDDFDFLHIKIVRTRKHETRGKNIDVVGRWRCQGAHSKVE